MASKLRHSFSRVRTFCSEDWPELRLKNDWKLELQIGCETGRLLVPHGQGLTGRDQKYALRSHGGYGEDRDPFVVRDAKGKLRNQDGRYVVEDVAALTKS